MTSSAIETTTETESEFMTPVEAAKLLRYETPWPVYRLIKTRQLAGLRIGQNGTIRVRRADVLALLRPIETT
jgi:excisionase family DNA binding protein